MAYWDPAWSARPIDSDPSFPCGDWTAMRGTRQGRLEQKIDSSIVKAPYPPGPVPPRRKIMYKDTPLYEGAMIAEKPSGPVFLEHTHDNVYREDTNGRRFGTFSSGYRHRRSRSLYGGRSVEPQSARYFIKDDDSTATRYYGQPPAADDRARANVDRKRYDACTDCTRLY